MKIVALMGKAGSGKDSIVRNVMKSFPNDFNPIVSCTSRPPREGEKDGVSYYFITKEQFLDKVERGGMLEHTYFNGWYYGAALSTLSEDKPNLGVFNPDGIIKIQQTHPEIELEVYYIQASDKERLMRQLKRESVPNVAEIFRRWTTDEKDFAPECLKPIKFTELINEEPIHLSRCVFLVSGRVS